MELGGLRPGETLVVLGTGGVFGLCPAVREDPGRARDRHLLERRQAGAGPGPGRRRGHQLQGNPRLGEGASASSTGGEGADHVLEVGGGGTFARSVRAVRVGGTISLIGGLTGNTTEVSLPAILMRNIRVQGLIVGSPEAFEAMNHAIVAASAAAGGGPGLPFRGSGRGHALDGRPAPLRENRNPDRVRRRPPNGGSPPLFTRIPLT